MDSLTEKSLDWMIIPSAGTKVPSSVCIKSPKTISSLGISTTIPFRMTLLLGCVNLDSASMAFLLFDSWYKEIDTTKIIAKSMNMPLL